jgi:Cof subfamily protein (haloacid dehalogenase superfamily)
MTRISLVVSDVDGTLVTSDKHLTPPTIAAVEALRESGILFSITSSRPGFGMRSLIAPLKLDLPIGPFNGSSLVNPDLTVIEESVLPRDAAQKSLALLARHKVDVWVFTNAQWLIQRDDGKYVPHEFNTIATAPHQVDNFGDALDHCCKIVGASDDFELLARCEQELQSVLGTTAHAARSQNYYLDVTPPGRDKGTFVAALAARLDIPLSEVVTIGDMSNDLPMFAKSGYSFAMGNASDAVKAQAKDVTDGNNADGFAKAMRKLLAMVNQGSRPEN